MRIEKFEAGALRSLPSGGTQQGGKGHVHPWSDSPPRQTTGSGPTTFCQVKKRKQRDVTVSPLSRALPSRPPTFLGTKARPKHSDPRSPNHLRGYERVKREGGTSTPGFLMSTTTGKKKLRLKVASVVPGPVVGPSAPPPSISHTYIHAASVRSSSVRSNLRGLVKRAHRAQK